MLAMLDSVRYESTSQVYFGFWSSCKQSFFSHSMYSWTFAFRVSCIFRNFITSSLAFFSLKNKLVLINYFHKGWTRVIRLKQLYKLTGFRNFFITCVTGMLGRMQNVRLRFHMNETRYGTEKLKMNWFFTFSSKLPEIPWDKDEADEEVSFEGSAKCSRLDSWLSSMHRNFFRDAACWL